MRDAMRAAAEQRRLDVPVLLAAGDEDDPVPEVDG